MEINQGEIHAIMGPNGSRDINKHSIWEKGYEVSGSLKFEGKNLPDIPIEERAQNGIFLAFQYL